MPQRHWRCLALFAPSRDLAFFCAHLNWEFWNHSFQNFDSLTWLTFIFVFIIKPMHSHEQGDSNSGFPVCTRKWYSLPPVLQCTPLEALLWAWRLAGSIKSLQCLNTSNLNFPCRFCLHRLAIQSDHCFPSITFNLFIILVKQGREWYCPPLGRVCLDDGKVKFTIHFAFREEFEEYTSTWLAKRFALPFVCRLHPSDIRPNVLGYALRPGRAWIKRISFYYPPRNNNCVVVVRS